MSETPSPLRAALVGLVEPVRRERDGLAARIEELEAELAEARQTLRDVDAVIERLTGERRRDKPGPKPKPGGGRTEPGEESIAAVRTFLDDHPGVAAKFTTGQLVAAISANGGGVHRSTVQKVIGKLYERGVITRAERVRGGYAYTYLGSEGD